MGANFWLFNPVGATVDTGHEKIGLFKRKDVKGHGYANNTIHQSFCLSKSFSWIDNLTCFYPLLCSVGGKLRVPPQVSAFPGTLTSSQDPACKRWWTWTPVKGVVTSVTQAIPVVVRVTVSCHLSSESLLNPETSHEITSRFSCYSVRDTRPRSTRKT